MKIGNLLSRLALVCLVCLGMCGASLRASESVLFRKKSPYNTVLVTQEGDYRILKFKASSGYFVEESRCQVRRPWHLLHDYLRLQMLGLALAPSLDDILVVGLGGGSLSNQLAHALPHSQVDSLELDPVVVEVARRYFSYREDERHRVFIGDARQHLEKSEKLYDVIFLDAFDGLEIPKTLRTQQFYQLVQAHLKSEGVVVTNLHQRSALYASDRNTLSSVFQHSYAFQCTAQAVILCQDGPERSPDWISESVHQMSARLSLSYSLDKFFSHLLPNSGWDREAPILVDSP